MDSLVELVDPQIVLVVGAIAVLVLALRLVLQVLQAGFGSLLALLAIVLVLYYLFGVSPKQLLLEISHLPQDLVRWAQTLTE